MRRQEKHGDTVFLFVHCPGEIIGALDHARI